MKHYGREYVVNCIVKDNIISNRTIGPVKQTNEKENDSELSSKTESNMALNSKRPLSLSSYEIQSASSRVKVIRMNKKILKKLQRIVC